MFGIGMNNSVCLGICRTHLAKFCRQICSNNSVQWAGHSKWANIRHTKAEKDGERAAMFRRFGRQIQLIVQETGISDPALNSQLRSVIQVALKNCMPMTSIQNAIKKCQEVSTANVKRYRLDLRYKQKVFVVCIAHTENYGSLKMNVVGVAKKAGATLVEASGIFEEYGLVQAAINIERLPTATTDMLEEVIIEDAIECGAEDVNVQDANTGLITFTCSPEDLKAVCYKLQKRGYTIQCDDLVYAPTTSVHLDDEESKVYEKFLAKLRELPAIEEIYDNIDNAKPKK